MSARTKLINRANEIIIKEAFDFSSIENALKDTVSKLINPHDIVGSISQILFEGLIIAKFGPLWGLFTAVLDKGFNINIESVYRTVINLFKSHISTTQVTAENAESSAADLANKAAQQLGITSDKASQTSIEDVLSAGPEKAAMYYKLEEQLIKQANSKNIIKTSSLLGFASGGFITSILKMLFKALLMGSLASLVGGAIVGGIRGNSNPAQPTQTVSTPSQQPVSTQQTSNIQAPAPNTPKPADMNTLKSLYRQVGRASGQGEQKHINNADYEKGGTSAWYLKNDTGDFGEFLYDWIETIYPDMNNRFSRILQSRYNSIYTTIRSEFEQWSDGEDIDKVNAYIRVPPRFKTVKQIVDEMLVKLISSHT